MSAITKTTLGDVEVIEGSREYQLPRLGDWFWLRDVAVPDDELLQDFYRDGKVLVSVTGLGSNYVEVTRPKVQHEYGVSEASWRVHLDKLDTLEPEPHAEALIAENVAKHRQKAQFLLKEVNDLTRQLGVGQLGLPEAADPTQTTAALVRVTTDAPVKSYKSALVKAKEITIPQLFEAVKVENALMAAWLTAELLPLQMQMERELKPTIERIERRIFNVELYAGLVETVTTLREGKPAAVTEQLHLMQRRCYMDEECLAGYEAGGMDFQQLSDFESWLSKQENFERVLPFPRCLVAFRVRRHEKEYEFEGGRLSDYLSFLHFKEYASKENEQTFLYLRNGEQLHRLITEFEFDEKLFPDEDLRHLTGKLYARKGREWLGEYVESELGDWRIITEGEFEERKRLYAAQKAEFPAQEHLYKQAWKAYCEKWAMYLTEGGTSWDVTVYRKRLKKLEAEGGSFKSVVSGKEMVGADDAAVGDDMRAAHRQGWYRERPEPPKAPVDTSKGFRALTDDNVWADDIREHLQQLRDKHNRLVLILQGLLDRSPVLHPHPQWQLWTEAGFTAALVLHYDASRALNSIEKPPSFEAYRQEKNQKLRVGSVVAGAQFWWKQAEREKDEDAAERRYDSMGRRVGQRSYRHDADPGPGILARVVSLRAGKATFAWTAERQGWRYNAQLKTLTRKFTVEVDKLLCLDDYQPGDFKKFFADPRTREEYLQWAPYLLAGEDYVHGKRKVQEPPTRRDES